MRVVGDQKASFLTMLFCTHARQVLHVHLGSKASIERPPACRLFEQRLSRFLSALCPSQSRAASPHGARTPAHPHSTCALPLAPLFPPSLPLASPRLCSPPRHRRRHGSHRLHAHQEAGEGIVRRRSAARPHTEGKGEARCVTRSASVQRSAAAAADETAHQRGCSPRRPGRRLWHG